MKANELVVDLSNGSRSLIVSVIQVSSRRRHLYHCAPVLSHFGYFHVALTTRSPAISRVKELSPLHVSVWLSARSASPTSTITSELRNHVKICEKLRGVLRLVTRAAEYGMDNTESCHESVWCSTFHTMRLTSTTPVGKKEIRLLTRSLRHNVARF